MSIAIVDDEEQFRLNLEACLDNYLDHQSIQADIDCFRDAESFLTAFEPKKYSIIFMDIYMGRMNGVDAAKKIRETDESCILIFCTTSVDHMPDAFACHAFDYMVKPADQQRVDKIMDDAIRTIPQQQKYLSVNSDGRTFSIFYSDLISITSSGHYLSLMQRNERTIVTRLTMPELLEKLENDSRFLIINRGILVNMDHVTSMSGSNCQMDNGISYPIKVRNSTEITQKWHDYCFEEIRRNQTHITERR
ncbi:MAG: response regulator transcription factor [Erysipelotrichia bacterium]|nr:response regulator transcription factor [Erysipelotrichia bacterium]